MAPRPTHPQPDSAEAAVDLVLAGKDPAAVVRRAPFSDRPDVGARGQRTQQRILDAALEVFGAEGYHQCSIERVTKQAGCSHASFYQYFSSKEDIFLQLTGQVARQLNASTEALGALTPDAAGWASIRAWVSRHADIHDRYEPVFHAFHTSSELDEEVARGSARWRDRTLARIRSRLSTTVVPARQLDPVILLLMRCVTRTHEMAAILRSALPTEYTEARVGDAMTDVIHRTLFGLDEAVNVHGPPEHPPTVLEFDPIIRAEFSRADPAPDLTPMGLQTFTALLEAGAEVFPRKGYHATRIDDIVELAGVSHGAFYRYFENKDHLARVLAIRAMRTVAASFVDIPSQAELTSNPGTPALRRWLRDYNATQNDEAAMLRVWVEAAVQDATLRANSAPAIDWGRRRMASFLRPRGFGDADADALILVALLNTFGVEQRPSIAVDAAAIVTEHGLLGVFGGDTG